MAKLFLSYSRKDAARAERLAQWLEREGHDVWRDDEDIGGGASFSSEIEKALKDCDVVLVLWSAHSVQSAWVRDEAGIGRDAGKLIPISLDGAEPPLGFRQFQSIDLSKWKGHGAPTSADRIKQSINKMIGSPVVQSASAATGAARRPFGRSALLAGIVALLAALIVLGFYLARNPKAAGGITIAVVASPSSPDRAAAINYADITAADMASFLPVHSDKASVIIPGNAGRKAHDYVMEIAAGRQGKGDNASITLTDASGSDVLWSKSWSATDPSQADMRQPISLAASHAALCLLEATTGPQRLKQPALGNYMSGCTELSDPNSSDAEQEAFFTQVVELAPNFVPGWANLALERASILVSQAGPDEQLDPALKAQTEQAIARTLKLDPRNGRVLLAQAFLTSAGPGGNLRALDLMERASALRPDDALIQATRSGMLRTVGRMTDSVNVAQRAEELDPYSPYVEITYIVALRENGQRDRMESEIRKVRDVWRDSKIADNEEFGYHLFQGDPKRAESLLPSVDLDAATVDRLRLVLAARLQPTQANIDAVLASFRGVSVAQRELYLSVLAMFGRTDEIFTLLSDKSVHGLPFGPEFAPVRKDPRFMKLAADLGLVRYWRTSGKWPDFCSNEQLDYDCKTEAAKYPG